MSQSQWTYNAAHRKRPHVHPLRAPSGAVLTRDAPPDHPWHHGLWFTIKYVNGDNFWEEQDAYGVLRHHDDTTLHWIKPDRSTVVVREHRTLTHVSLDDAYAIDWHIELAPTEDVVFDRTPFTAWGGYGGLALRGRPDWTDTRILLDDGTPQDRVLGARSRWCDLSGRIEDGAAGVLILDAPGNPGHPVPWYGSCRSSTYGDDGWSNFLNAAFLWEGPLAWSADGDPLTFDYRVVVHDGMWDPERCSAEHRRWIDG